MRSKNKIKETVCVCLTTRMRARTYFIWVIWILNHHMYFAKISTSSHPHVWLLAWLCISVSWLAVWCQTLLLSDRLQSGRCAVSGVFRNTQSGDTTCTTLYFTVFLYYSEVRGVRGVLPKSYNQIRCYINSSCPFQFNDLFNFLMRGRKS